jgi:hypothetical protein
VSLLKLERLRWHCWIYPYTPLSLYSVPSLKELELIDTGTSGNRGLKLGEVLRDTMTIHNLTLDLLGEKVNPCSFFCTVIRICILSCMIVYFILKIRAYYSLCNHNIVYN